MEWYIYDDFCRESVEWRTVGWIEQRCEIDGNRE
jgi:hypothetical protein